jgi:ubiquinone/menaquinone biosynthesis C-methylase UbiE
LAEALGGFDAKSTYDDASRDYEDASRDFWQYLSIRTVDRLGLRAGERVLDVPCGSGPSLVLAAERVGPSGRVVGIDYAEQMVAIAREKVGSSGLGNVELHVRDMTALETPSEPFDAVLCSLGLFFAEDMAALIRSFFGLVRPGSGRVAVTVFGEYVFDPMREAFVDAVREVDPGVEVLQPWRRTEDASVLRTVFRDAGVDDDVIETDEDRLPLRSPDDWWRIVMGSGFRRTVVALGEPAAMEVRARCDAYILDHGIDAIVNRSHSAVARRHRGGPSPSSAREEATQSCSAPMTPLS